jgi:Tol biopolymer transport system component
MVCAGVATFGLGGAVASFPGANGDIAFENSRDFGIALVGPDGGAVRTLPASTRQVDPAFSADGRLLAYAEGLDIYVRNLTTGAVRQVTRADANDQMPAFSPDGRRIVFLRASVEDLFVVNIDGTGLQNLTNDSTAIETDPSWSPNGSRISYTRSGCAPGSNEGGVCVWVMNADGSGKTLLTPEETLPECPDLIGASHRRHSEQPSWSPNSSQIAYAGTFNSCSQSGGSDIWVMNADGTGKRNLIGDSHTRDVQPSWSPDGTRIAFVSDRERTDTAYEIWTVSPAGGGLTRLTNDNSQDQDPDWGPRAMALAACENLVRGTAGGDRLNGTSGGDRLLGLGGSDVLNGLAGDDCLDGGPGRDTLNGGAGNDRLVGGSGANRYSGGPGNDTLSAANRLRETVDCGSGRDTATVDRRDRVRGCERVRRR